jgi:predicted CoA-binding protein
MIGIGCSLSDVSCLVCYYGEERSICMHIDDRIVFVVVGVSRNKEKYGYRVWKSLVEAGFETVAVNPACEAVDGQQCYPSISRVLAQASFRKRVEKIVVVTVVPPVITEQVVEECVNLGITKVWMQPGSESEKSVQLVEGKMEIQSGACLVVDQLKQSLWS